MGGFFQLCRFHCLFLRAYFNSATLNSRFSPSLTLSFSLDFLSLEAVLISVFALCSGRGVGIVRVFVVGFSSFIYIYIYPEVRRNVYFLNFIMLFSDENGATFSFSLLGF